MADLEKTADELALVNKAIMEHALVPIGVGPSNIELIEKLPPLRCLQAKHAQWLIDNRYHGIRFLNHFALRLVGKSNWELIASVEADKRDWTYEVLGDILRFTCTLCTILSLDFQTLSQNFENLPEEEPPRDFEGVTRLFKAIGMLASSGFVSDSAFTLPIPIDELRQNAGVAIVRICRAFHWLAFNSDWDANVLFQETMMTLLTQSVKTGVSTELVGAEKVFMSGVFPTSPLMYDDPKKPE